MAVATVTVTPLGQVNITGDLIQVFGTLNLSASYATAGDLFDPRQFGLAILRSLIILPGCDTAGATPGTHAIIARVSGDSLDLSGNHLDTAFDLVGSLTAAQGKIQAFWCAGTGAALVEVTSTTNLSAYTFDFIAWGV